MYIWAVCRQLLNACWFFHKKTNNSHCFSSSIGCIPSMWVRGEGVVGCRIKRRGGQTCVKTFAFQMNVVVKRPSLILWPFSFREASSGAAAARLNFKQRFWIRTGQIIFSETLLLSLSLCSSSLKFQTPKKARNLSASTVFSYLALIRMMFYRRTLWRIFFKRSRCTTYPITDQSIRSEKLKRNSKDFPH